MRADWVECCIENIAERIHYGFTAKSSEINCGAKYLRITDIQDGLVDWNSVPYCEISDEEIKRFQLSPNDLVFARTGGTVGKSYLLGQNIPDKAVFASYLIRIGLSKSVFPAFVYAFFQSNNYWHQININKVGLKANVNAQILSKIRLPIPPLPEQRAIVAKIEQLFSELDNGIANLKAAQAKLDIYRQAVLKQAFEGELTREWREKEPVIPTTALGKIADIGTGATPKKSEPSYWNNGDIAWVTSGALNDLFVNMPSDLITAKAVKETNCKVFPIGTLLVAMYGEGKTRGKCSELKIPASTNQAIAAINLKSDFVPSKSYVKWFLVKNYNDIRMVSSGGVQPNLNLAKVKSIELPFPSIEEQNQIVQEIEARLSVCDKLAETIQTSLQQAEALRQSILKKAFEGRLLTTTELQACRKEADWMPAEQLLVKIKSNPT